MVLERKLLFRLLKLAASAAIIGLLALFIANNYRAVLELEFENPFYLLVLIPLAIINIYATGKLMAAALIPLEVKLSNNEAFGLAAVGRFLNYISPGYVGLAARAGYTKKVYNLTFTKFISSTGVIYGLNMLTSISFMIVSLTALKGVSQQLGTMAYALVGLAMGLAIFLLTTSWRYGVNLTFLPSKLRELLTGWHDIRQDYKALTKTIYWLIILFMTSVAMLYMEFKLFGGSIGAMQSILISSLNSLNAIFSITPAGLGIVEGLNVFGAAVSGADEATALAASLIRRVVSIAILVPLALYYSNRLFSLSLRGLVSQKSRDDASDAQPAD